MWRCNSCGTENKSDSSFCKNCGSPKPKRDKTKYFLLAIIGILSVALVFSTFAIIRLVSSSKAAPPPAPTKNLSMNICGPNGAVGVQIRLQVRQREKSKHAPTRPSRVIIWFTTAHSKQKTLTIACSGITA